MLETSARLLRLLSLLQARRDWTSAELAARLGAAGRARVVERFTWRAVAEQTVAWYRTTRGERPC